MISISPGHYGPKTGAHGILDEVTEAIKVSKRITEILRSSNIQTNYIEDNISKSQKQNIPWLIAAHNKTAREIDVSIHFNSSSTVDNKGKGVETLIVNGKNIELATKITDSISKVSGLKNRGVKIRTDLGLLKGTNKPCYLIEICFINDSVDVALYKRDFEKICQAIANELATAVNRTLKSTTNIMINNNLNKRAIKLIEKAVLNKTFTSPHKDVSKYTQEQLYEYMIILGERLMK